MKLNNRFATKILGSVSPSALLLTSIFIVSIPAAAADLEKGKQLFATLCASCHGNQGAGDGPIALSLPPEMKPRNLQTEGFKFAVDDAKMKELLQKGGAAVGLNPLMPPQPSASDADIENLTAFVKSLKK